MPNGVSIATGVSATDGLYAASTISTAGGTPITSNTNSGRFRMNSGTNTVVINNNLSTSNCKVFINIQGTIDATMTTVQGDTSVAGQITFRGNANASANKDIDWLLIP